MIGVYHAGVELGIFEGITQCASGAVGGSHADILADIMATPLVRCDQVQVAFLGISMAGWNAILSIGSAMVIDRKSVVEGKSVSVRVDLGGRRIIKKKKQITNKHEERNDRR